ncbi:hypothetical protein [Streptomyces sp. NPDC006638]|uniref:hypothetical protein n=1 Tax=Streptomyces sp. NPDC006638 TaxID=3157183 RepID=UPI0033B2A20B
MSSWERFNNRILSITSAEPGWQVETQTLTTENGRTTAGETTTLPVIVWAVVEVTDRDDTTYTRVEPVFNDGSSLVTATECRRLHSDVEPEPGNPKEVIRIKVIPPGDAVSTADPVGSIRRADGTPTAKETR